MKKNVEKFDAYVKVMLAEEGTERIEALGYGSIAEYILNAGDFGNGIDEYFGETDEKPSDEEWAEFETYVRDNYSYLLPEEYEGEEKDDEALLAERARRDELEEDFGWRFPEIAHGGDFLNFTAPEFRELYPEIEMIDEEFEAYVKANNLEDELYVSGIQQGRNFDNLPEQHKQAITDMINRALANRRNGGANAEKESKGGNAANAAFLTAGVILAVVSLWNTPFLFLAGACWAMIR